MRPSWRPSSPTRVIASSGRCRSFTFEGLHFDGAFRVDLLIDARLLVEIKSVERLNAAHAKQLLTYLRLTGQPLGLLINFGGATLKEGLAGSSMATPPLRLHAFA